VELLVILLLALVVFGPDRLPGLARNAGLWIGRARGFTRKLGQQVERELAAEELRKAVAMAQHAAAPIPESEPKA
jgi:sec-independent protein translocase protein TatB